MKIVCLTIIFVWLSDVSGAFAQSATSAGSKSQKKEQTVIVRVNKNGSVTEKDTVIIVTKGEKLSYSADNVAVKVDTVILAGDGKSKEKQVTVFVNNSKGTSGKDSVRTTCFVTTSDTAANKAIHNLKWLGDGKRMIIMQDAGSGNPDFPVLPDGAQVRMNYTVPDTFAFDTSDPDIVSYKKKDIGKDKEKITIIRKKKSTTTGVKNIGVNIEK